MADTTNYTVQDLQDNLDYLDETKKQIKQAIIGKGQTISDTDTFRSYVQKINDIQTGVDTSDATATANDIISPKTAYVNEQKVTGAIIPTYKPLDTLNRVSLSGISMQNPKILQCDDDEHLIVFCTINGSNKACICSYDLTEKTITLDKDYYISNLQLSSMPEYGYMSLSTRVNTNGDYYMYILLSNKLYCYVVNFINNTIIYKTSYSYSNAGGIVCNPVYPNLCYVGTWRSGAWNLTINVLNFNGSTVSNTVSSVFTKQQFVPKNPYMNISNDGSIITYRANDWYAEGTGTPLLILSGTPKGGVISSTKPTVKSCMGVNPSGTKLYEGLDSTLKIYSITKESSGTSISYLKSVSGVSGFSNLCGIDFIDDHNMIICNGTSTKIYTLGDDGLQPTLFNTIFDGVNVSRNIHRDGSIFIGTSNSIIYVGNKSSESIAKLNRSYIDYYNTLDANASAADILGNKIAYSNSGKIKGTMYDYSGAYLGILKPRVDPSLDYVVRFQNQVNGKVDNTSWFRTNKSMLANFGEITPEKIVKGYTIYDVVGNAIPMAKYSIRDNVNYTVQNITSNYGFILNDNGYYESNNNGEDNSISKCKVTFTIPEGQSSISFDCINYAESNYDYGVMSNVDTELSNTIDDTTDVIYKSFRGLSSPDVVNVEYTGLSTGEHFIEIKYRKDSSQSSNNDDFQFKPVGQIIGYKYSYCAGTLNELPLNLTGDCVGIVADTGKSYTYDNENNVWVEVSTGPINTEEYNTCVGLTEQILGEEATN